MTVITYPDEGMIFEKPDKCYRWHIFFAWSGKKYPITKTCF
jgi:hypothetical protein